MTSSSSSYSDGAAVTMRRSESGAAARAVGADAAERQSLLDGGGGAGAVGGAVGGAGPLVSFLGVPAARAVKAKNEDDDRSVALRSMQRQRDAFVEVDLAPGDTLASLALR